MKDRLLAMRLFARLGARGSITAAGRELGLSQSQSSRMLTALEDQVGATLFRRTTRALTLTKEGKTYLERVLDILAAIDEADQDLRPDGELRGTLRVGLCTGFMTRAVIPRLPKFSSRHPLLSLEFLADDQVQDLVVEGLDLALRWAPGPGLPSPAQPIYQTRRVLVASPEYLRQRDALEAPADLVMHTVILSSACRTPLLSFRRDGVHKTVKVLQNLYINLGETALAAAVMGLGIVCAPESSVRREVAAGQLVQVLEQWDLGPYTLYAVHATGKSRKAAATAFSNFLLSELAGTPGKASVELNGRRAAQ